MKYLKSTSEVLKLLFDQHTTVKHIAESFRSFDDDANAEQVKSFMKDMDFDVIGVVISLAICKSIDPLIRNYLEKTISK